MKLSLMETLLNASSPGYLPPKLPNSVLSNGFCRNQKLSFLSVSNVHASTSALKLSFGFRRKSVIVGAKKSGNKTKKEDTHSFVSKPDEAIGIFPEAVLLKEKRVQEDGKLLPEFADEEEEKLYEYLNLQLQSELNEERMRHYEVVYLIHEKEAEATGSVNERVQDFLREKKGKIWRLNDWGMRRLAYKIKKAKNAHYILMNFELEAKYINDFKSMLDKDERIIRHLVIKRDEAITEDCPPPPEFHTLRADMDDYEDDNDDMEDEEDYEDGDFGEDELDAYGVEIKDGIVFVNREDGDDIEDRASKLAAVSSMGSVNK